MGDNKLTGTSADLALFHPRIKALLEEREKEEQEMGKGEGIHGR